ncbi:MAG TPA: DUF4340 domain-containing protein [Pirellulales bacterium]
MKEQHKTLTFVLVAAIAGLVAWEPWRPSLLTSNVPEGVGEKLFPEFKDPLAAKSLEVVTFNEEDATLRDFKVAQNNGVWSIPSHSDYPADAADHMAQAATALLDLEKLNLASDKPGDQELYGVIAPDVSKLRPGMVGVGTRIIVKGDQEKPLADLVIGKDVKDQPGLRYVRSADRDQIYVVKVKTDKFSTKFEDWIEKDLLKLQAFDVRDVELNDYSTADNVSVDGGIQLQVKKRNRIKVAYDDTKSNWKLIEISEFDDKGKPIPGELAEDEELNNEKLNALKTALDDLKIVDVQRKPKGLSQDLKASDELVKDNEAALSLVQRGFFPVGADREIYSSEGEATCTTKDGIRYVLRFGRLAGGDEGASDAKAEGDSKEKSNPALNRYLFVMAQFDESQIAKPQLEPLAGEEKSEESEADASEKPADAKQADEDKKSDEKPDDAAETKTAAQDDDEKKFDEKAAAAPDAPAAEEKKPTTPDEEKQIAFERENKRKQDEYDNAIKKGQEKVKELNERFADWYFIIPDDVYKKIHLGRADIVKKKEPKDEKDAAGVPGGLPGGLPGIEGKLEVE